MSGVALFREVGRKGEEGEGTACVVEATGIVRTYRQGNDRVHALRGVDLRVRPGEFVAITGPSGSGKSTLLHVLGGLDRPDEGDIRLEGRSISSLSDQELAVVRRRRLGLVLQFFNLLPTLSAQENVAFPLNLDGDPKALEKAERSLASVGLRGRLDHRPSELSGGEQQRVALARALAADPAAVLADEPTGNLDSLTSEDILGLLRETADNGQTIIMVTHDLRSASYADRVVRLVDGRLVELTDDEPFGSSNVAGS